MDGSEKIDLILVFGTGGMLVLALAIIAFVVAYQRRMFAKQNKLSRFEIQLQRELMTAVILEKEKEQKNVKVFLFKVYILIYRISKYIVMPISQLLFW